jgi:hypothetical protein
MALVDFFLNVSTGDIDLTDNQMRLTANIEECVRQKVLITLETFRGEWVFNINFGVPYLENSNNKVQLLGKTSKTFFDTTVKSAIEDVEGIVQVTRFESTLTQPDGTINIDFSAITQSGEVLSPTTPITLQV